MGEMVTVDTARLDAAGITVGNLASRSNDVGVRTPVAAMGASHELAPTASARALDDAARALVALADGVQASLSGFSHGLRAAAHAYTQVDRDAANRAAAAAATVEVVL